MGKVFVIGFNKTGTTSLHYFFERSGYKSMHWQDLRVCPRAMPAQIRMNQANSRKVFDGVNFDFMLDFMDDNLTDIYKTIDQQYPGSKFILNVRPKMKWIVSRLNHGNYVQFCNKYYHRNLTWKQYVAEWSAMYDEYITKVKEYFKDRLDFLVYNIEKDPIQVVIDFLKEYKLDPRQYRIHAKTSLKRFRLDSNGNIVQDAIARPAVTKRSQVRLNRK